MLRLARLLRRGETEGVEFKEAFGREAIETVCAFANAAGGTLLVGVGDRGQVRGVELGRGALRDWANQISQGTGLHPSLRAVRTRGKTVVVVRIEAARFKPVMYQGRPFIRCGSTTRQMRPEDLARAVLAGVGATWDEIPDERAGLGDLDWTKVREFRRLADKTGRRRIPERTSRLDFLRKLGLVREDGVTRAAVLLFGKEPQAFYGEAVVKAGRLRGEALIVDDREIGGTLFEQVEAALDYLRERLETRFERTGRPRREVIWEYPLDALREAVTNAVCHRDYLSNGQTQIRIEDRTLTVLNPGGLPAGLSVAALKRPHASVPRNRLISRVFYYAGLIERWGSGIGKMLDACAAARLPEPAITAESGFNITFRSRRGTASGACKYDTSTEQVKGRSPTSAGRALDKHHTSGVQVESKSVLLELCLRPMTVREMMAFLGFQNRVNFVKRHLRPLLEEGLLVMTDPDSPRSPRQKYVATEKGLRLLLPPRPSRS